MKTRYSGKSFKDSSTMKKSKLSIREKRKIKREKKKNKVQQKNEKIIIKRENTTSPNVKEKLKKDEAKKK